MKPEQVTKIAEHAKALNQPFGRYLLNAWDKNTPDGLEIDFFHADDDDLVAAEDAYWEEHKAQIDGPIVAEYETHEDLLAAEGAAES
jgi:hypothetical protein